MSRFWSILFFLVPVLGVVTFLMAMWEVTPFGSAWLPKSLSESGDTIDQLFNGIHFLSAFILLGTGLTIAWALWRYDDKHSDGRKALYIHHNTKLEIIWTIIPALILIFLAFFQMKSWTENKMVRPVMTVNGETVERPPMVMVKAKRFGWEFYYAGADGIVETQDDVYIENLLYLPSGEDIVLQLESRDVIHSFYVPELRLKQDIVPGMTQFVWFNSKENADIEIICTELCGWGHYKMKADLRFVSRPEFDTWLAEQTGQYSPNYKTDSPPEVAASMVPTLSASNSSAPAHLLNEDN